EVAYHYYSHGYGFAFYFYVLELNHSTSYARLPTSLEDIRLLLDQRSEAQFQWTPYEDPAIRAVILDEYFQNLNGWHVKVSLVNFAIVEMHQSDKVLQQFGFRQSIFVAPKATDAQGIARGAVGELFFLPIPITLRVSNTFTVGDANTSTVTILLMWVILPTPTTRSFTEGIRIPPEQPQPPPKAGQRRNPARNRRRPPCSTESGGHGD
ncbi:hypothetical protein Gotur_029016, partial [Gossypium turneri]